MLDNFKTKILPLALSAIILMAAMSFTACKDSNNNDDKENQTIEFEQSFIVDENDENGGSSFAYEVQAD